jgi:hypothetical protein
MPDKRISIELNVDEDLGGLKKAQSALDQFSRGGQLAVEKLGDRVAGLRLTTGQLAAQFGTHLPDVFAKFLTRLPSLEQGLGRLGSSLARILFGLPPSGAFATPPFFPSALAGFAMPGHGPSAAALGAAGIPGGGLLDFLRQIPLRGIGSLSGQQVLQLGLAAGGLGVGAGRLRGTLTGAGSGALTGFSFGGPIGAAIGAVAGGLLGFFGGGQGKRKEQASGIADRGFAEIRRILDDYVNFRREYGPALAAIQAIWAQMVESWQRIGGGVGQRSIRDQRRYFEQVLEQMRQIEEARGIRGNVIHSLPAPSFQHGGFATGGLAFLHPGEFVLSARAVERLGASLLQGLNVGGAGSARGGGMALELSPASAEWLGDLMEHNPDALSKGIMAVIRRGGSASRALRG